MRTIQGTAHSHCSGAPVVPRLLCDVRPLASLSSCARSDRGIHQPLEVFRTRWKGWGLRCTVDLEPGAFVATYEGEVITTAEAVSAPSSSCTTCTLG